MGKLLDYDPFTGITETYHKNGEGFVIQTSQDVSKLLDRNKNLRNSAPKHWRADMHHVASIHMTKIMEWRKELGDDPLAKHNRKWLMAKLNDIDNKYLRTKEGKL